MRKSLAIGFVGISIVCVVWSFSVISKSGRNYTEPDPTKFDPNIIKRGLQTAGIEVDVVKVIYVNQDSTTYIFEGKVRKVNKSIWNQTENGWVRNPSGVLFEDHKVQPSIVGYSTGSTPNNLKPFFVQQWKDLVK